MRLARAGLKLEELQRLATVRERYASGAEASAHIILLLEDLRQRLDARLADIEVLRRDLERAEVLISQCQNCPKPPNRRDCSGCPVDRNIHLSDLARLVWDPACP